MKSLRKFLGLDPVHLEISIPYSNYEAQAKITTLRQTLEMMKVACTINENTKNLKAVLMAMADIGIKVAGQHLDDNGNWDDVPNKEATNEISS